MCKPANGNANNNGFVAEDVLKDHEPRQRNNRILLLTTESFSSETSSSGLDEPKETKHLPSKPFIDSNHTDYWKVAAPPKTSAFFTIAFIVASLFAFEHALRYIIKDSHVLFEDGVNHMVLARHLGVDFTCCFLVAYLGVKNRHLCDELWQWMFQRSNKPSSISTDKKTDEAVPVFMCPSRSHARLLTYHPAAQQILAIFLSYQIKNLYDSIVWNDGPEFIFHHIAAGLAAYSGLYPGHSHFYAVFFMGISEISTTVLTLLANFDEKHGVPGLETYFAEVKVALAAIFVVAFIVCRTILWPIATYYYFLDVSAALKNSDQAGRTMELRGTLKVTLWCLIGLSVLQVGFLYQIFVQGKSELEKMGYL